MNQSISRIALLSLLASSVLLVSMSANARAIRIDGSGGGGAWTIPVESSEDSLPVNIGFTFNFFGTTTDSLTINANGSVSFGGVVIAPFLDISQPNTFSYSTTTEEPAPGIPNAFRVQWGTVDDNGIAETDNLFQLAIFDLTNGVFAMEFNYGQITAGSDATSSIGFDNGAGTSLDLLAELGGIRGLGGPLLFDDYEGIGNDGFDFNDPFCPDNPPNNILACNNYYAGAFGPTPDVLPPIFGQYFQGEVSTGVPAQGRYLFLVDNRATDPNQVPEPATLWLLGIGLAGLAMSRRRRKTGIQTP